MSTNVSDKMMQLDKVLLHYVHELKKMPGAWLDSCGVQDDYGRIIYLGKHGDRTTIMVENYADDPVPLDNIKVIERVTLCELLPRLLEEAQWQEPKVLEMVDVLIEKLQFSLHTYLEDKNSAKEA